MTKAEFMNKLETEGWDFTVGGLSFEAMCDGNKNLEALCEVYQNAYRTDDYQKTNERNRRADNADRRDYGISRFRESALHGRTWCLVYRT